jgi:hypothetical protein
MAFDQFAEIVRDWSSRNDAGASAFGGIERSIVIDDLPRGITPGEALAMTAKRSQGQISAALLEAAKSEPASMLTGEPPASRRGEWKPRAKAQAAGRRAAIGAAQQPVGKRARTLLREQLADGPKPESTVMAAAHLADIPERSLIAAASSLGVCAHGKASGGFRPRKNGCTVGTPTFRLRSYFIIIQLCQ